MKEHNWENANINPKEWKRRIMMRKLYELPKNSKLYIEDKIVIFDHIDGIYSYCYLEEDRTQTLHISCLAPFRKYKDGYKLALKKGESNDKG